MTVRTLFQAVFTGAAIVIGLGAASPGAARAEQVTIKMWMHEHPPRIPIDKAIIAEFEKANPDVKVQYEVIAASEYPTKLITAFAAGSGPDLFNHLVVPGRAVLQRPHPGTDRLRRVGLCRPGGVHQPIPDRLRRASALAASFTACRPRSAITPVTPTTRCGKPRASTPRSDFPKTWEEMPAIAEKLTKRDANGVPIRRGFDFDWPSGPAYWLTLNTMMHQLGANVVDEAAYKATFDGPEAQHVMQYLVDWVNKYKLGGPQYTDSRTDFLGGNLATDCSFGIWGIPQMRDAKIDYTVKPLPRFADAKNDNGLRCLRVLHDGQRPVRAGGAEGGLEAGAALHQSRGAAVHRRRAVRAAPGGDCQDRRRRQPGVPDELKKAKFGPRVVGYSQLVDIVVRGRDAMMQGGQPIASVLPQENDDMNAVLKREKARAEAMLK